MLPGLKPYLSYKDSGVDSLGKVPEHWDVRRLGSIGRLFKGNGGTKEDEAPAGIPCVRYGDIYMHHRFFVRETRSRVSVERASDYTAIRYGDVLFAGSGETIDEIGKSVVCLIDSPACCGGDVIVLRPSIEVDAAFMGYSADSRQAVFQKSCMGRGITVMHIYGDQLRNLRLALPPVSEQAAIARYLGHMHGRIRRSIRAKQNLIKVLEEQRQSISDKVVTGQLDVRTGKPYASYAQPPVRWLGRVPAHWEVRRAKFCYREVDERSETGDEKLLSVSHLTGVTPRAEKTVTMFMAASYVGHKVCRPEDLVINTMWAWMGALGVSPVEGMVSPAYGVYRPRQQSPLLPGFADILLRSHGYVAEYRRQSTGIRSSRLRLYPEVFLRTPLICPPKEEQIEILAAVDGATRGIGETLSAVQEEIHRLQELRTRLVDDVVTGKLDVREAAANLPDEAEETGSLVDEDLLADESEFAEEGSEVALDEVEA